MGIKLRPFSANNTGPLVKLEATAYIEARNIEEAVEQAIIEAQASSISDLRWRATDVIFDLDLTARDLSGGIQPGRIAFRVDLVCLVEHPETV